MKRYMHPVQVATRKSGAPERIEWKGHTFHVEAVEDFWVFCGQWWKQEEKRFYFRVQTEAGSMELFHRARDGWILSRVLG
jgi:hypothetical protein